MVASDAVPKAVAKVGKPGTSVDYSRGDHQHALDPNLFTEMVNVQQEGVDKGSRQGINFKAGTNIILTVAEDAPNERVNVEIATKTGKIKTTFSFAVPGTLTSGTFKAPSLIATCALIITKVKAYVRTAPTGLAIICDINKKPNGSETSTTIFTTQANRPTIAASTFQADSGIPDVTSLAEGDRLDLDIDQVGSTIAGAELTVEVVADQTVVFT